MKCQNCGRHASLVKGRLSQLSSDPYFFPTNAANTQNQTSRDPAAGGCQPAGKRAGKPALVHGVLYALGQQMTKPSSGTLAQPGKVHQRLVQTHGA